VFSETEMNSYNDDYGDMSQLYLDSIYSEILRM